MKVCLLAYEVSKSTGQGVCRYGAELYDELLRNGIDVELVTKKTIETPMIHDNFVIPFEIIKRLGKNFIFHSITPRQGIYTPLILRPKSIVTILDMIPLREQEIKDSPSPFLASIYGRYVYNMAKKARKIITISSLIKKEIIENLNVDESKIEIAHLAAGNQFKPLKVKKEKLRVGYVGGLAPRKRVGILIKSFNILMKNHPDLDCELFIYGPKGETSLINEYPKLLEMTKQMGLKNVHFGGFVPYEKLVPTYNSLDVFVFPTKYEGFGMPIIEAQRCGLPVITMEDGNNPEEVVKKTIQCKDEKEVSEMIFRLLTDKKFKNKISKEGLKYSKRFTWENCAKKTIKVYEELV